MRTFCGFYRVLFVLMFVMSVGGIACSDDTEKPGKDVEVEEDVSSEDVGDNADVSSQDVESTEDVAEDVSGNDVGDKVETGGECPEGCLFSDWNVLSCDGCAQGYCYLRDYNSNKKPSYCTGQCMSDAVCKIYGEEWRCDMDAEMCVRESP